MAIVVKNTFLDVEQRSCAEKRRSSMPLSFKPAVFAGQPHPSAASTFEPSAFVEPHSSIASTEPGSRNATIGDEDSVLRSLSEGCSAGIREPQARSKSRAKPNFAWEPSMRFKFDFAKVMKRSVKLLRSSELITDVQKYESSNDCLLTIKMSAVGGVQKEQVEAFVQDALLEGVFPSKSIYIIGFREPSPFIPIEFGFDFKFGAMENAKTACWHFFKKGFCRHGDRCNKQHAIWEWPTRVRIEAASESLNFSDCSDMHVQIETSPNEFVEPTNCSDMKKEM